MARTTATVHRLDHLRRDRGYRFTDRDPDLEFIADLVSKSELSVYEIAEKVSEATGGSYMVAASTINNWCNGKTKRPQNFTLGWVAFALGYERKWTKT